MEIQAHTDANEEDSVKSEIDSVRGDRDDGENENNLDDSEFNRPFGNNGFQGPLTETEDGSNVARANSSGRRSTMDYYLSSWRFLQFLLLFL